MDNNHQYRIFTVISIIKYILGLTILVLLAHETLTSTTKIFPINQILQSSIIFKALISIVVYLIIFHKTPRLYESIDIENMPLVIVNFVLGILALIYGILDFIDVILASGCYEWADKFNRLIIIIFIFAMFFFLPVYLQKRPDPDDRSRSITTISAGSFAFLSCFFIFLRFLTLGAKQSILNHTNGTMFTCNGTSSFTNLYSIVKTLKTLQISCFMFFFISSILIFFSLRENEKQIIGRQYHYQTLVNASPQDTVPGTPEINVYPPNNQMKTLLVSLRSNLLALIIGISIITTLIVYTVLFTTKFPENNQLFQLRLHSSYQIAKLIIYLVIIGFSIHQWFDVIKWQVEQNIRSKIDKLCINIGTFGQVINGLTVIISASYMLGDDSTENHFLRVWISANAVQIIQCLIHRTLILEILQRNIGEYIDPKIVNNSFWRNQLDPCLILCISNLGFAITNLNAQQVMVDKFVTEENFAWDIIKNFTIPLEILNRIHGFTFLFHVFLTIKSKPVNTIASPNETTHLLYA